MVKGMHGYGSLYKLIKYIRLVQEKDDNNLFIGITGRLGTGKSTLSIQLARGYVKKYFKESRFNFKKYVAYNNDEVFDKIHNLPKYSPIIADEAVRFAWSRDWNKSESKELVRLATQIRTKKQILFMNIPKLSWIDKAYREGMLDVWLWVHADWTGGKKQAYAMMFVPDENQFMGDSWHFNHFTTIRKKAISVNRFTSIDKIWKAFRGHPCYQSMFKYPPLPETLYLKYKEIRDERAFESKDKVLVSQRDYAKYILYNLRHNFDKLVEISHRSKRPISFQSLLDNLCINPINNQQIISRYSVSLWIKEVEKLLAENDLAEERKESVRTFKTNQEIIDEKLAELRKKDEYIKDEGKTRKRGEPLPSKIKSELEEFMRLRNANNTPEGESEE